MDKTEIMYSVKILYKYVVNGTKEFFEESVIAMNADSFEDAYEKSEKYVEETIEKEYINMYGEKVVLSDVEYTDCFQIYKEDEITEVYSTFKVNKTSLNEREYIDILTQHLTADELLPLRYL